MGYSYNSSRNRLLGCCGSENRYDMYGLYGGIYSSGYDLYGLYGGYGSLYDRYDSGYANRYGSLYDRYGRYANRYGSLYDRYANRYGGSSYSKCDNRCYSKCDNRLGSRYMGYGIW